ncbi:MAG: hypothetical protein A2268_04495 [Candidatus Raymondbacteria bacterium RifOxyA12_full_50_37]|uniref:Secretion system C-terminal sorting domain-containing protein n=1 Tax=Candidatus Raymondbacteria bacterium RIFOXYD12_FULL_49_13 TaxID=1817890 RepID=A0A1F7FBI6_UNCRA|nr:MAG: hypothetical protein A2268_04495 [Candidatus Raymondbacteria bacterium RifOxyA12_full_50_37]OGJ88817.1 MAG: hypothetical protein A2350_01330 [Candidatus Raymondbacteria bacterium RifOxyB12_full_50_8]OGJ92521.1 MAG: hypothetical protein A2248_05455 [Candidatus Raymondbacteria bacterium RIFOXYA2_FULL_49_16]OGJ97735.1 MAG: hypothetical protein A2487_13320 [Candidatus Raymondbacteria bacterium RifOxyC12_full_50_8]OGJ97875.1 MAG: hypothetical protein A2453_02480 [Candidatus Raymondbacteria b
MRALFLLCIVPALLWAQNYYEASGQSRAFTLAAGQKAEWNNTTTVGETAQLIAQGPLTFSVYPNPSNGRVSLSLSGLANGKVSIYAVNGVKVSSLPIRAGSAVMPSMVLPNGIYFARLESVGKTILTKRFLVVR